MYLSRKVTGVVVNFVTGIREAAPREESAGGNHLGRQLLRLILQRTIRDCSYNPAAG